MPLYTYKCPDCGDVRSDMRTIAERHAGPFCVGGVFGALHKPRQMTLTIDPVRGIVKDPAVPKGSP